MEISPSCCRPHELGCGFSGQRRWVDQKRRRCKENAVAYLGYARTPRLLSLSIGLGVKAGKEQRKERHRPDLPRPSKCPMRRRAILEFLGSDLRTTRAQLKPVRLTQACRSLHCRLPCPLSTLSSCLRRMVAADQPGDVRDHQAGPAFVIPFVNNYRHSIVQRLDNFVRISRDHCECQQIRSCCAILPLLP
jgi:hypothetical protein